MDPQLTKQLIRRRLILENSLEVSLKDEDKIKKTESSLILETDIIPPNSTKHNFLEKIKKFESFNDNQIKKVHKSIVTDPRNNFEIINKFSQLHKDPVLKKTLTTNKLDSPVGFLKNNKQKQGDFHEKVKQFESLFLPEKNKVLRGGNTINVTESTQASNQLRNILTSKSSKSDYNNWKVDKNWVFYDDYIKISNKKNVSKNKFLKKSP